MNQFDPIVAGALDIAQTQAVENRNTELYPEHLLLGLILNPNSWSHKSLMEYKGQVEGNLKEKPTCGKSVAINQLRPDPMFSQWITQASSQSIQEGRKAVNEMDLVKLIPQFFPHLKIDYSSLQPEQEEEVQVPNFLINLNELAEKGKLDPVIGRTWEIRALMEILGRRSKNNPVLVGPAGVGKTAIVEGLAYKILKGSVPDVLKSKTVYSLDLGSLMAGTKFRGEFEERMQQLLKFIKNSGGENILFIDEIHQLVGAGRTEGAMDATNLLKPALARGELNCIGATTYDEYQKYILNDSALERRFREIKVDEPSKEDAIEILMGIRDKFEAHHGIKISNEAIYQSVFLSDHYITNKNLPDKAIDLIDEAASSLKLSAEAMPGHLVELESDLDQKGFIQMWKKITLNLQGR